MWDTTCVAGSFTGGKGALIFHSPNETAATKQSHSSCYHDGPFPVSSDAELRGKGPSGLSCRRRGDWQWWWDHDWGTAEPFRSTVCFSQLLWMKSKHDYIALADGHREWKSWAGATRTTAGKAIKNGTERQWAEQSLGLEYDVMEELGTEWPE